MYDENIYYDDQNKTVITTYNKHIAMLEMEKTTMSVNDSYTAIKGTLKEKDGVLYLPFSDMGIVYDFEYDYNKEENVLLLDSISEPKSEAVVLNGCKVKENTGLFSKKLEKLKKTQYVTVLSEEGKYTKVRTSLGNIGYVKTKKLSSKEVIREAMVEHKLENIRVLDEFSKIETGYGEVPKEEGVVKIVIPNLFNINGELEVKNIINLDGNKYKAYSEWASQNEVSICGSITFDGSMNNLCSKYETRTYVINSIYTSLIKNKISMICIDFASIDNVEGFYRFVTEMVPRFKEAGIKVLVKNKDNLNVERLEKIVDYVI